MWIESLHILATWEQACDHLAMIENTKHFRAYPLLTWAKIFKIQNSKVGNDLTRVMDTFWSTEINFCPISTYEGSISVSDTTFSHSQGFFGSSDVKKPSQPSVLWQKTAREQLLLSCLRGSLGTKITLKTTPEGVITTRNTRIARGVMRRCS